MTKRKSLLALMIPAGLLLAMPFSGCVEQFGIFSNDSASVQRQAAPETLHAIEALLAPPRDAKHE